jgi:hypothetical protein
MTLNQLAIEPLEAAPAPRLPALPLAEALRGIGCAQYSLVSVKR